MSSRARGRSVSRGSSPTIEVGGGAVQPIRIGRDRPSNRAPRSSGVVHPSSTYPRVSFAQQTFRAHKSKGGRYVPRHDFHGVNELAKLNADYEKNAKNGREYMDAKGKIDPPADPQSVGKFLAVPSLERITLTPTSGTGFWLILTKTRSAVNAVYINISTGSAVTLTAPQLNGAGPTQIRPLRLSAYVRNTTVFTSLGGVVRVLNTPTPIPWEFNGTSSMIVTTAFQNVLSSIVDSNPSTKTYSAKELQDENFFVSTIASNVKYHEWVDLLPISTNAEKEALLVDSTDYVPMNNIIIHMPSPPASNSYDWAIYDQSASRFPANSLYQQLAREAPRVSPETHQRIQDGAAAAAESGRSVVPTSSRASR
jgi:hypothetical protein